MCFLPYLQTLYLGVRPYYYCNKLAKSDKFYHTRETTRNTPPKEAARALSPQGFRWRRVFLYSVGGWRVSCKWCRNNMLGISYTTNGGLIRGTRCSIGRILISRSGRLFIGRMANQINLLLLLFVTWRTRKADTRSFTRCVDCVFLGHGDSKSLRRENI